MLAFLRVLLSVVLCFAVVRIGVFYVLLLIELRFLKVLCLVVYVFCC